MSGRGEPSDGLRGARAFRVIGWILIVVGIPLTLVFGVGLLAIGGGVHCLVRAKLLLKIRPR